MRHQLVFLKFAVLIIVFLVVLPPVDCKAQRHASRKAEKELFGKTGKSKPLNDKVKAKGAAGKAMKEQEKKEARRDKEDEKKLKELRKRQFEIQSTATQERMVNNGKKTQADYQVKQRGEDPGKL
jgi:small-conductance mechanosensitive channel